MPRDATYGLSLHKISGPPYTARQQFQQMNADLKAAGKSMKDMGLAATSVASSIAGSLDVKLNGTLKTSLSLIS